MTSSLLFRLNSLKRFKKPRKAEPKYGKTRLPKINFGGKISSHPLWVKGSRVVIKISAGKPGTLFKHLIYTQVMRGEEGKENPLWNDKEKLDRKEFLKEFSGKGHQKYYRLMISPEKIYNESELKSIVKKCISVIKERYYDEPVYGAVIHRKSRGLHAHVVIRSKTKKERYIDFRKSAGLLKRVKLRALEEMARIANEREKEKKLNMEIDEMVLGVEKRREEIRQKEMSI